MFNAKEVVAVEVDLVILPAQAQEDHHGVVVTEAVIIIIVVIVHP